VYVTTETVAFPSTNGSVRCMVPAVIVVERMTLIGEPSSSGGFARQLCRQEHVAPARHRGAQDGAIQRGLNG
jgi:hypothetical protein